MCNRYGYLAPVSRLIDEFSQTRLPLIFTDGAVPNLAPRAHIRPTEHAPIIRALDPLDSAAGTTLSEARWWLIPFFHRGGVRDWKPMCTNARAETVATTPTFREPFRRRRCLVPASCYYEWTGDEGAKVMWRFTRARSDLFCFAGLWDRAQTSDGPIESFTIITSAAGEDTAAYHNRAPVILGPDAWSAWLTPGADSTSLLRPLAPGSIEVARA